MKRFIIPTAGALLLVSAGLSVGVAQEHRGRPEGAGPAANAGPGHGPGPGPMNGPGPGKAGHAERGPSHVGPPPGEGPRINRPEHVGPSPRAERPTPPAEQKRAEPRHEQPNRNAERHGLPQHPRAQGPEHKKAVRGPEAQPKTNLTEEHRRSGDRDHTAKERDRGLSERNRTANERSGKDADRDHADKNKSAGRGELQERRERLSENERVRLRDAFDVKRARVNHVTFDVHIGRRIPRHVRLFPVPYQVISFFPYYRSYSYFVVGEDICIVNPRTYEIVDVIDYGYRGRAHRPQVAGLHLSTAQIALVRDAIPPDFPVAGIRLRLALGAEIPDDVQLNEFPNVVIDRVRELERYRFVVVEDQIVIVDPRDRSIALVIDRA